MDYVLNVQADASLELHAPCAAVWKKVANLSDRPTLKSWTPKSGTWPEETASARVVMDKGSTEMVRTETVVRMVANRRLLVKVEAPELSTLAWLDSQMQPTKAGCTLSLSVIVALGVSGGEAIDRKAYVVTTTTVLKQVLEGFKAELTPPRPSRAWGQRRDET